MLSACFIVEGSSEVALVRSDFFRSWLKESCHIELLGNPQDGNAKGNGSMCGIKIGLLAKIIRKQYSPDLIIVLADLDPEVCAPCITERKKRMLHDDIDQVLIIRNALEAWFLADTMAMRDWLKDDSFYAENPEAIIKPWETLKIHGKASPLKRGPGKRKPAFVKRFIKHHHFNLERAAEHENCPSARYCISKLKQLGRK